MASTEPRLLPALSAPLPANLQLLVQGGTDRPTQAPPSQLGYMATSTETLTTADATVAVGHNHRLTIAGLTANVNFELPASSAIGSRVRVHIVDGDADYAVILKGATGVTINGGTAAAEWSRLFIANEFVEFLLVGANAWVVVNDGRIPSIAVGYRTAQKTLNYSDQRLVLDNSAFDNANLLDTSAGVFTLRRAGACYYRMRAHSVSAWIINSSSDYVFSVRRNSTAMGVSDAAMVAIFTSGASSRRIGVDSYAIIHAPTVGDVLDVAARRSGQSSKSAETSVWVEEVFLK